MKQVLSINQVNDNLAALKTPNKLQCYHIHGNRYTEDPVYYLWLRGRGLYVVHGKKVYSRWFPTKKTSYAYDWRPIENIEFTFRGLVYTENPVKDDNEKLLLACGLKNERQIKPESDLKRLQTLGGRDYVRFYKLIQEVTVTNTDIRDVTVKYYEWNREKESTTFRLVITHTKGEFSFPIENINENDSEIQDIFFNLLGMPVNSKVKAA